MATDSFRKAMGNDRVAVATDSIEVAWQQLQTSEAYWAGYSGMLIGGLIYSVLLSLLLTVLSYGMLGVVTLIGVTIGCLGLIGVIGALIFLVVRAINASLGWPLRSRIAAASAACLTGMFLSLAPLLAAEPVLQKGIGFAFVLFGPVLLVSCLQAGAWLFSDWEIRRFERRVAFSESDKVVAKNGYRFDISKLLLCTFWLAGAMAIFGAAGSVNDSRESFIYVVIALSITVFLSFGLSMSFVGVIKATRALQKKLFYRKRRVVG